MIVEKTHKNNKNNKTGGKIVLKSFFCNTIVKSSKSTTTLIYSGNHDSGDFKSSLYYYKVAGSTK